MREQFLVKKWGWENAWELKNSPDNIVLDFLNNIKQSVVVSAIRSPDYNTTDNLIELWKLLSKKDLNFKFVLEKIEELKFFHLSIVDEKIPFDNESIKKYIEEKFIEFTYSLALWFHSENKNTPNKEDDYTINNWESSLSILWFWENLSAYVHESIINNLWIDWLSAGYLDLSWVVPNSYEDLSETELFKSLSENISNRVQEIISKWKIPIIPWYIPWFSNGIENAIWRWYSDATASMSSVWLSRYYEVTLEIQKSVLGMLSSDPRVVKWWKTKLIEQIDYLTAKEITGIRWAQAKLLHNQVLRKELQEAWISVRLFDPFSDSKWTLITKNKNPESSWVEFIWGRNNVTFFSISSWKMSDQGILSGVFSIVKNYASVDIISTSETEISFTVDSWISTKNLDSMTQEIRDILDIQEDGYENFVKYTKNKALVFCVWQNLYHSKWTLWKAALALSKWDINIEMVSQWIMERAIVFWINWSELNKAINLLHEELIW